MFSFFNLGNADTAFSSSPAEQPDAPLPTAFSEPAPRKINLSRKTEHTPVTLAPEYEQMLDDMLTRAESGYTTPAPAEPQPAPAPAISVPADYVERSTSPKFATSYRGIRLPLSYNTVDPHTEQAYLQTQRWLNDIIHNFSERARWLILYGRPGTGKSHLLYHSAALLREFRRKVVNKRAADCASSLREGETHLLHQFWAKAAIFMLDDFGSEYHTDYMTSQWFDLFDQRIGKWTLITTNLTPAQIGRRYDARIQSRIEDTHNTIVDLTRAADYRTTQHR